MSRYGNVGVFLRVRKPYGECNPGPGKTEVGDVLPGHICSSLRLGYIYLEMKLT